MENKVQNNTTVIDEEIVTIFPASNYSLNWDILSRLKTANHSIAIAINKSMNKNFGKEITIKQLKNDISKNLKFLSFFKIDINYPTYINPNTKETTNKIFGKVCYNNNNGSTEMLMFIINNETGSVKYFD